MKNIHRLAFAFSILASAAGGIASAAEPMLPPVGTLAIAPFGSLPVAAWSWGASNSGTAGGAGTGAGTGRATSQGLSVTRLADGQSPAFFKIAASGEHLATVALVDGATTVTLADVLIASYSTEDSPPGNIGTRIENITFIFAKADYTVNGVTTCFNFAANAPC